MKFRITLTVYATVDIEPKVIDAVDDGWRDSFYDLRTPEEVAGHIGRNLILGSRLSMLDGFADQDDDAAHLEVSDEDIEVERLCYRSDFR